MKALIRDNEIITDSMRTDYINWENGMPLTSPYWVGGAYTLVKDYVPPVEIDENVDTEPVNTATTNTATTNTETQNTELTPEEIEKQKKIEALEKTLEALKNS